MLIEEGIETTHHNTILEQGIAWHEARQYAHSKYIERYHDVIKRYSDEHTPLFFTSINAHWLSLCYVLERLIHVSITKNEPWERFIP